MHGELAQLVSLAAYGTTFLEGPAGREPPELYPSASVFKFTNSLEFHRHSRRLVVIPTEAPVAVSSGAWFADLRSRGAIALRLNRSRYTPRNRFLAPHIEAGFSGGLDVSLIACFPRRRFERWWGRWNVTAMDRPDQRIWHVQFHGARARFLRLDDASVDETARRLDAALGAAVSFVSRRQHFEGWEKTFRDARSVLSEASPEIPYHPDLLPPDVYGLEARRLLAAASHGWVFGGMGSWNDVALGHEKRYKQVTAELFEAVLQAVVVAANSGPVR